VQGIEIQKYDQAVEIQIYLTAMGIIVKDIIKITRTRSKINFLVSLDLHGYAMVPISGLVSAMHNVNPGTDAFPIQE